LDVHEVGVVDDGGDHFALVVEVKGLLDKAPFARDRAAVDLQLERLRGNLDHGCPNVELFGTRSGSSSNSFMEGPRKWR